VGILSDKREEIFFGGEISVRVGCPVGIFERIAVGEAVVLIFVGANVGSSVRSFSSDGAEEVVGVGRPEGLLDALNEEGENELVVDGRIVGGWLDDRLGNDVGSSEGDEDGIPLGTIVGRALSVGLLDGF